jgi:hypothetical protein
MWTPVDGAGSGQAEITGFLCANGRYGQLSLEISSYVDLQSVLFTRSFSLN